MTRARKFSGKTVDEATESALAELGAELEDVEIKVISTGRSGILGFGGEPAEIEISRPGEDGSPYSGDDFADSIEPSSQPEAIADGADSDDAAPRGRGRSRNRNRGRGRGRGREGRSQRDDREQRSDNSQRSEDSQPIIREKDEEAEQLVSELIDYFLGAMGVVADTYIREDEEDGSMTFEIEGQDAGLLIGRRGETLQALQFLIRMVTNRQLGRKAYVVIDIEDYRERRIQMLRRLARRTAGRVGSSGREDSLEPMSPAERRIVHMALAGHPDVRTESEGEGNQRRVVIFPND